MFLGEKFEGQFLAGDRGKELQISSATIHNYFEHQHYLCHLPGKGKWYEAVRNRLQSIKAYHPHLALKWFIGVEHLHLRGLRKPSPYNASLLHQVALLLWHAFLSLRHPGRNRFNSNSAPSLMASIISCQFNMLLPSCRVAQWCWHPLATQPPRYP